MKHDFVWVLFMLGYVVLLGYIAVLLFTCGAFPHWFKG